jgi:hypothetical protein
MCKKWCKTIDNYSGFRIEFNELKEQHHQRIGELRIRAFEFSGNSQMPPFLQHPLLVREIILGANVLPETAKNILSSCVNVVNLKSFSTGRSDTAFDGSSVTHRDYLKNLKKLKTIEIGIFYYTQRPQGSISNAFSTLIGNRSLVFSGIVEITISYPMTNAEWVELCHFADRHSKTLTSINVSQCFCEAIKSPEEPNYVFKLADLKLLSHCRLLRIGALKMQRICTCRGETFWSDVLPLQQNVETLATNTVPNLDVISDFVNMNWSTIRCLKLYDVSLGMDANMNGAVFQKCTNLQELLLTFQPCAVIVIKTNEPPQLPTCTKRYSEFYGMQLLPKSLRSLTINGCLLTTSSLLEASKCLTNLEDLSLRGARIPTGMVEETTAEYGIRSEVLFSFMKNIRLSKVNLHTDIIYRDLSNPESKGELQLAQLIRVLTEKGLLEILPEFDTNEVVHHSVLDLAGTDLAIHLNRNTEGSRESLIDCCRLRSTEHFKLEDNEQDERPENLKSGFLKINVTNQIK